MLCCCDELFLGSCSGCGLSYPQPPDRGQHVCAVGIDQDPPVWHLHPDRAVEAPERLLLLAWLLVEWSLTVVNASVVLSVLPHFFIFFDLLIFLVVAFLPPLPFFYVRFFSLFFFLVFFCLRFFSIFVFFEKVVDIRAGQRSVTVGRDTDQPKFSSL